MKFELCELVCLKGTHRPIPLPHRETVVIGRTKETRISNPRCSREQLEICADWESGDVMVKQLGSNNSAVDDRELFKGEITRLPITSTLHILANEYPHVIKVRKHYLNSPNSSQVKDKSVKKRHFDTEEENIPAKKLKTEHKDRSSNKFKHSEDDSLPNSRSSRKKSESPLNNGKLNSKQEKINPVSSTENEKKIHKETARIKEIPKQKEELKKSPKAESNEKSNIHVKPCEKSTWGQFNQLMIYNKIGLVSRAKIAGFDMDGTIICTKSGKTFPQDASDWRILFPEIPAKLKKAFDSGYKIVLFTNQHGVQTGQTKMEDMQKKISNIVDKIGIPIQVFVATGSGVFRKPVSGMWTYLQDKENDNIPVNAVDSFYVGDAAGRPDNWKPRRKKDFSCSDRLFAINIGVKFYTPEEYFLSEKPAPFNMPDFDPRRLSKADPLTDPLKASLTLKKQEMVIFVGFPASGKSTFVQTHFKSAGYVHANRDTLGSWQKCAELCRRSLTTGKSVVVDNTNPDVESRKRYIDIARQMMVPCRCFRFTASLNHARHNEKFRVMIYKTKPVNDIIMHSYKKKFVEPNMDEGFTEILKVNFVPNFQSTMHEKLYTSFLLDRYFNENDKK